MNKNFKILCSGTCKDVNTSFCNVRVYLIQFSTIKVLFMSGQILSDRVISKGSTLFKLPDTFPNLVDKSGTINCIYSYIGIHDLFMHNNEIQCRYEDLPASWYTINQVWIV